MYSRIAFLLCFAVASPIFAQAPEAVQPGKEHQLLHKNVGERTGMMKMWPMGPDSETMVIPVKETNTLLHNGLWLHSTFECGPYKGSGVIGYDPEKKKYVGNWINNQTADMSIMEGTYDEAKHELTMTFRGKDNTGKMADMKSVTRSVPGKPELFIMMRKDDDKWVTDFEVTYDSK